MTRKRLSGYYTGIPHIEKYDLKIPDNFLKYACQNYYVDRFTILSSLIAHEICHAEYGLANGRIHKDYFGVDKKAIEMLAKADICSAADFYKSLQVMRSYWFATDLEDRLKLISREYKVRSGINFKRSKETV